MNLPSAAAPVPTRPRPVVATLVAAFAFFYATFALVVPMQLQPELLRELALSDATLAWINGTTFAAAALGGFLLGRLADVGRRRIALAACVLVPAIGLAATALATDAAMLAIARALTGLGVGGGFGVAHTAVAAAVPTAHRPFAAGVVQAGSPLGIIVAALLGGELSTTCGRRELLLIAAAPGLLVACAPWVRTAIPESAAVRRAFIRRAFPPESRRATLVIFGLLALHMGAFWMSVAWIPQWLRDEEHRTTNFVKDVQLALGVGFFAGNLMFGSVARRIGMRLAFFAASLTFAGGIALLPMLVATFADRPLERRTAMIAVGVGAGLWTAFGPFFTAHVNAESRGVAASTSYQLARATQLVLQPLVPVLRGAGGFALVFAVASGFAVLGGCGVVLLKPRAGSSR